MKYIRKYEEIKKPAIGDYVIVDVKINKQGYFEETLNYIQYHIGQIVNITNKYKYEIYYDRFPYSLEDTDYIIVSKNDIEFFSRNIEECKDFLKIKINIDKYSV